MENQDEKTLSELKKYLSDKMLQLGLNTAHDYDCIETLEDILIYTKAIITELEGYVNGN